MARGGVRRVIAPVARPVARRVRTGGPSGSPRHPSGWLVGPPDFVGVGAQRAGTTWWYDLVSDHPSVHRGAVKECQFFERYFAAGFSASDLHSYHQQFPRPPGKLTGEWSPRYMHDFWTPPLLQRAAPDAKILVLLRDPLERYLSGLRHEFTSSKRAVRRRRRGYIQAMAVNDALDRSLYGPQLKRLFDCFDRAQVLVLQYERCRAAPAAELRRTYEFLGASPADHVPSFIDERAGRSYSAIEVPGAAVEAARHVILDDLPDVQALVPEIELALWPSSRDQPARRNRD
jgi:hypothetical protein